MKELKNEKSFEQVCFEILVENKVSNMPTLEEISKLNSTWELYKKYILKKGD